MALDGTQKTKKQGISLAFLFGYLQPLITRLLPLIQLTEQDDQPIQHKP